MLSVAVDLATSVFNEIFGNSLFQLFQITFLFMIGINLLGMLKKVA